MMTRLLPFAIVAINACYSSSAIEGLPCSSDQACGPDHVCTLGYCYAHIDDALADCDDGIVTPGELCYPLSRRVDLDLGDGELHDIDWGDLDGDGLDDALTVTDAATLLHLNIGSSFSTTALTLELTSESFEALDLPPMAPIPTVAVRARQVALGEFRGAALTDVVFSLEIAAEIPPQLEPLREIAEGTLWLIDNQGNASVSAPIPIPGSAPLGLAELPQRGLQTGDFDGDGRDDLLVASPAGDDRVTHQWFRGSEDGLLPPLPLPLDGGSLVAEIADIDEDGLDDLVQLRPESGTIAWLLGPLDASGARTQSLEGSPHDLHVAALDGSPGLDLALLLAAERQLWSWDGGGWHRVATQGGRAATDLHVIDLDDDGRPELVTATTEGIEAHAGFPGPELGASFVFIDEAAPQVDVRHLDSDRAPELVLIGADSLVVRFAAP